MTTNPIYDELLAERGGDPLADRALTLDEALGRIAGHIGTTAEDVTDQMFGLLDTALGRVDLEADHG